jgi:hypothetical protein
MNLILVLAQVAEVGFLAGILSFCRIFGVPVVSLLAFRMNT